MYNVPEFKTNEAAAVIEFMQQHPFITLCGVNANNEPVATHIPVLIEERENKLFLLAHIMKNQLHTIAFKQNAAVLAIFNGANSYVSATNYIEKNTASTWNYQAVHASGLLSFLGEEALLNMLKKLTRKFENNNNSPALVENMDENYVKKLMKAIVAFEIEVTNIEHVFKLSQNKDQATRNEIINTLNKSKNETENAVANNMKKNYNL